MNERWCDRAADAVMMTPMRWFDKTNGRPVLKVLSLIWFLVLMIPCLFIAFPLIAVSAAVVLWDEMK